jgi:hypothetical protein
MNWAAASRPRAHQRRSWSVVVRSIGSLLRY